jgi:hypothetical protein
VFDLIFPKIAAYEHILLSTLKDMDESENSISTAGIVSREVFFNRSAELIVKPESGL